MDIKEGDLFIVGNREYPIKSCAEWPTTVMNSRGFKRSATVTAGTKRTLKGAPATVLSGIRCTPLDPVDPELRKRLGLDTPHELLQTFLADSSGFVRIILEDLKR